MYLAHVEQLDVRGVPLELVLEEGFVEVQVPVVEPESSSLVDLISPFKSLVRSIVGSFGLSFVRSVNRFKMSLFRR